MDWNVLDLNQFLTLNREPLNAEPLSPEPGSLESNSVLLENNVVFIKMSLTGGMRTYYVNSRFRE